MAQYGQRAIIEVDDIANVTAGDYGEGTLVWDRDNAALYCQKGGAWKAVTVAA